MLLTIDDINQIQNENANDLFVGYTWLPTTETAEPQLKSVRIFFRNQRPDIWRKLVTSQSKFDINIAGTRNEAHDSLDPCYRALLAEVNHVRAQLGQDLITN